MGGRNKAPDFLGSYCYDTVAICNYAVGLYACCNKSQHEYQMAKNYLQNMKIPMPQVVNGLAITFTGCMIARALKFNLR